MTRVKIFLITLANIIILTGILYVVSNEILMESFQSLENEQMVRDLIRTDTAIANYQNSLEIQMRDWAEWDDTYYFIEDKNDAYIESNLSDGTLVNLEINFMAFVATTGEVVYSSGVDLEEERSISSEQYVNDILANSLVASAMKAQVEASIIIEVRNTLLFVGIAPITMTDGDSGVNGLVLFARFFDDSMIKDIANLTQLNLTLTHTDEPENSPELLAVRDTLFLFQSYYLAPISEQTLAGYTIVRDTNGDAHAIIKVLSLRDIYTQGKNTVSVFMIISSCAILLFGIIILLFFEKLLLSRLSRLSKEVASISIDNLSDAHIHETKSDEIGILANKINNLLVELSKAHTEEMKARQLEHEANENLKKSMKETEEMNKLMVGRELKMIELKKKLSDLEKK